MKCDGTRAETRFRLSARRTSPFKSARVVSSVDYWQASCAHQSAGFVLLVQACVLQSCDAYWLPTPLSCFPFTSPPVRHRVPSHFNWTIHTIFSKQALCLVGVHIPPNTLIIVCQTTRCQMPGHHNIWYMYRNTRLAVTQNPGDRAAGFDCRQGHLVTSSHYGDQLQNCNSAILSTVLTKIALQKYKY